MSDEQQGGGQVIRSQIVQPPSVAVDSQTVRWLEQAQEYVEGIITTYSGHEWQERIVLKDGKQLRELVQVKVAGPTMNADGLHYLRGALFTLLKKEIWLSNYPEERLAQILDTDMEQILAHLASHETEYALSPENLEQLAWLLQIDMEASYRRPVKNLERKHLFGSFGTDESLGTAPQQQQGGSFFGLSIPKIF